jgi:disulfide bond formation protein DsbB
MTPKAEIFNLVLSLMTLLVDALIVFVIFSAISGSPSVRKFLLFLKKYAYQGALLFSLSGVIGSLIYSNIIGFEPCSLCWWQRVFLYSIAFLLILALWRKERVITNYIFGLSTMGIVFALYHSLVQLGRSSSFCNGLDVDCSQIYFSSFGFVTIPFMSLTIFAAVGAFMLIDKFVKN